MTSASRPLTLTARRRLLAGLLLIAVSGGVRAQQIRPGTPVATFTLLDMTGHAFRYRPDKRPTVVMFFSTRCPISNAFNYRRNRLYGDFKRRVRFVAVDANANESLAEVRQYASDVGFDFPVYKDTNNAVADQFGVRATTDTFAIDASGVLRYRGYVEDSPNPSRSTNPALRLAIEALLAHKSVAVPETRAIGCALRRVKLPPS